jgi:pimeloyl-ACP methyl ester carboxylesterase
MKSIFTFTLLFFFLSLHSQERYVSIDGQKFFIKELGAGDITVIFENGMSDSLEAWWAIPNMVLELTSILKHENINPPYILVGHSLGGYITRYFSSQFPDDVKGLLLLDPAPEAFWESMSKRKLKKYIEGGNEWYRTKHAPKYWKEWHQFIPNMVYMKNLNISKNLPIILVSATESNWYKYHERIIAGFKNARHVELAGGHYIHMNHPDLIVGYIKELSSPTETTLIPRQ